MGAGGDVRHGGGQYGDTPLHLASTREAAQVLVEAGADSSAENDVSQVPLHMAAEW